jgi:hypothetical protein
VWNQVKLTSLIFKKTLIPQIYLLILILDSQENQVLFLHQWMQVGVSSFLKSLFSCSLFCSNIIVSLILNVKTLVDPAADAGKKKLVITEEHFQRVTQALVMRLRQHEESVAKDGTTDTCVLDFTLLSSSPCVGNHVQLNIANFTSTINVCLVLIKKTIPKSHLNILVAIWLQ